MELIHLKQRQNDAAYSLIAARDHFIYLSHQRGITPIMTKLKDDRNYFHDCIVVDKIIGKAAAMLLTLSHVQYIHGQLMSTGAMHFLDQQGIPYSFDQSCDMIINRSGRGMCPMEATVVDLHDPQEAYMALALKLDDSAVHQ